MCNLPARLFALFLTAVWLQGMTPENAREILARCDAARGNLGGVQWEVVLTELEDGEATETRRIDVKARGFDMVAETLAPPRQKGHRLLLLNNNMWFHKPGLSKPVPVSLRQKLAGRAANGDIAATNYAEDYAIAEVADGEHEDEACHVFLLEAQSRNVTYARVRYWVSKERLLGLRADYLSASGEKRLKTATMTYDNTVEIDDESRPFISAMHITDEIGGSSQTRLVFSEPRLGAISPREFSLQRFGR